MKLPPLSALRAFEAAIRLQNFTRAAEELNITHGAVSRHVAAVENAFDVNLFERGGRGAAPTRAGLMLYQALRESVDRLANAAAAARAEQDDATAAVRISIVHSFAIHWLLPRLPRLYAEHPGLDVSLVAEPGLADLGPVNVDFSIRYGLGGWDGVFVKRLSVERRWPVASPDVAAFGLDKALARYGILHDVHRDNWSLYFAEANLPRPPGVRERLLNDYTLCLESAAAGLGVALARSSAIERELASGRLVSLSDRRVESPRGYFLLRSATAALSQAAGILWLWIENEAAADALAGTA